MVWKYQLELLVIFSMLSSIEYLVENIDSQNNVHAISLNTKLYMYHPFCVQKESMLDNLQKN